MSIGKTLGPQCPPPNSGQRVGQVREEINMLLMEVDRLESALRSHYERIEPILCHKPQGADVAKESSEPMLCTHAKELRALRAQIYRMTEAVHYVTSIVEV